MRSPGRAPSEAQGFDRKRPLGSPCGNGFLPVLAISVRGKNADNLEAQRCRPITVRIEEKEEWMFTILIILLVLMLIGALPSWPYSRSWGYYPSGGLGLVVVILVILLLLGRV
jgi:hypothetical protein